MSKNKNEAKIKKKYHKSRTINYSSDDEVCMALIEICIYVCFLIVTTVVTLSMRHLYMFYFNKTLEKLFLKRDFQNPQQISPFDQLVTTRDWWNFLESDFINNLHGNTSAYKATADDNDKYKLLNENLLLGPPRMRQIRVRVNSCHVHPAFERYFNTCYAEYRRRYEDKSEEHKGTKYYTGKSLPSGPIWGHMGYYSGGGYMVNFTYDETTNAKILTMLKNSQWIDRGTRMVVVEFGLYNVNTDLFDNVKLIAELLPIGGILTSSQLQALQLHSIWTRGDYGLIVAAVIFYAMIIFYTVEEVREIINFGCWQYVTALWNLVDVIILVCGYLSFAYCIWHTIYLRALLKRVKQDPNTYESLDLISYWNMLFMDMMAICAFCVWLKVFKYISFNKTLMQFSITLRRCAKDLLGFGLMFLIVFLAYALLGLLLFGDQHRDFRDFHQSFLTMMRMVLGDFEYTELERANRVLGPIYFLTYILLVFFILLNMFLAIINDTYTQVKSEIMEGRNYLCAFIKRHCRRFCDWLRVKCRCKRGADVNRKSDASGDVGGKSRDQSRAPSTASMAPNLSVATSRADMRPSTSAADMRPSTSAADLRASTSAATSRANLPVNQPQQRPIDNLPIKKYFADVNDGPTYNAADVTRLAQRVVLVEELLETLVKQMDRIMKRVDSKQKK